MFGLVGSDTFNTYANNGQLVIRVGIAMMCLSSMSVVLRFLARTLERQPLLWDDWWILIALPWAWVLCIAQFVSVIFGGLGQHTAENTSAAIMILPKTTYPVQVIYPLAIASIKLSILFFYKRVFSVHKTRTNLHLHVIGFVVLVWLLSTFLVAVFPCVPVSGFWDREVSTKCIDIALYYLVLTIPNVATDLVLLAFPLPFIWKLHLPRSQRVALTGIFMLGGFVVVFSILRLVTVIQITDEAQSTAPFDNSWNLVPLEIFNIVETNAGIVFACLPSMWPMLRILRWQKLTRPFNHGRQFVSSLGCHSHQLESRNPFENNTGRLAEPNGMVPAVEDGSGVSGPVSRVRIQKHPRSVTSIEMGKPLPHIEFSSSGQREVVARVGNLPPS